MGSTPRSRDGRLRQLKVGDLVPSTVALGQGPRSVLCKIAEGPVSITEADDKALKPFGTYPAHFFVETEGDLDERYEGVYVVLEGYAGDMRLLCRYLPEHPDNPLAQMKAILAKAYGPGGRTLYGGDREQQGRGFAFFFVDDTAFVASYLSQVETHPDHSPRLLAAWKALQRVVAEDLKRTVDPRASYDEVRRQLAAAGWAELDGFVHHKSYVFFAARLTVGARHRGVYPLDVDVDFDLTGYQEDVARRRKAFERRR